MPRPQFIALAAGSSDSAATGSNGYVPRALVIDDETTIRAALVRFFARLGWWSDEAEHGRAALERITAPGADYEVIICDLRMPVMSGMELHDHLAETRPELLKRVLLIAGDVTSAEVVKFLRRTACPLLIKPFELPELANAVNLMLKGDD